MKTEISSNPRFMPSLGEFLRERRKERGLTKQNVAKRAKMDVVFYDSIERGKRFVSLPIALRLAKILEVPVLAFEKYLEK